MMTLISRAVSIILLASAPTAFSHQPKGCESHLLSSFHMLVESAHKSGDLTSSQINQILSSEVPKNPMPTTGLKAHQLTMRKAIDRAMYSLSTQQWALTKAGLKEYLNKDMTDTEQKDQASTSTQPILDPKILYKVIYPDLLGFSWLESDPLKLAVFVQSPRLHRIIPDRHENAILFEHTQPFSPSAHTLKVEKRIQDLGIDPESASFIETQNGELQIVQTDEAHVTLIRLFPDGRIKRIKLKLFLEEDDGINSATVTSSADGNPLVAVTTMTKTMIYSPLKSISPLVSLESPNLNCSTAWLKIPNEEPLLVVNHWDGSTLLNPFFSNDVKFHFPYKIWPFQAKFIQTSDGQVYLATNGEDKRMLVLSIYELGQSPKEKK